MPLPMNEICSTHPLPYHLVVSRRAVRIGDSHFSTAALIVVSLSAWRLCRSHSDGVHAGSIAVSSTGVIVLSAITSCPHPDGAKTITTLHNSDTQERSNTCISIATDGKCTCQHSNSHPGHYGEIYLSYTYILTVAWKGLCIWIGRKRIE